MYHGLQILERSTQSGFFGVNNPGTNMSGESWNGMSWGILVSFERCGNSSQSQRRLLRKYLNQNKVEEYEDLQTRHLVLKPIREKDERDDILRGFGTPVIVQIAFGYDMDSENDSDDIVQGNCDASTQCVSPVGPTTNGGSQGIFTGARGGGLGVQTFKPR
ncbi:hypothetical protein P691DRAFT_790329 [Macrolepiota fuliginosa MF-IS2]|uniref:Uncharacterized protein n=1 Tax=Macrolepiota fuliginosa MF-IS2 TaxID=1400762 RepID=A0A9P5X1V5_9AGAR|nr:hypothetical protein P691DRAFT_790329 [Macrolepiota fuliginosa MF-IS2]